MKPQCFTKCDCGDMQEEHCSSRNTYCYNCELFFGYIERQHSDTGKTMGLINNFASVYSTMPMFPMDNSDDDRAKRIHLKNKVKSKRYQGAKWYNVIYR